MLDSFPSFFHIALEKYVKFFIFLLLGLTFPSVFYAFGKSTQKNTIIQWNVGNKCVYSVTEL